MAFIHKLVKSEKVRSEVKMGKIVFILFLWVSSTLGDVLIKQGVIFQTQGELHFSSSTHTYLTSFDSKQIRKELGDLVSHTQFLQMRIRNRTDNMATFLTEELSKINVNVRHIKNSFFDYLTTLEDFEIRTGKRRTRRFTNLFGRLMHHLGQLATDDELAKVKQVIESEVEALDGALTQTIEHIHITDDVLRDITRALNQTSTAIQALQNHFVQEENKVNELSRDLLYTQLLSTLALTLENTRSEVLRIMFEINRMLSGQLSPLFCPPNQLQNYLEKLQNNIQLLFPPTAAFLPLYYTLIKVAVVKHHEKLFFLLRIPLRSEPESYVLYETTPIWFKSVTDVLASKVTIENKFLAVRKDGKYFIELSDLSMCSATSLPLYVCKPTKAFFTSTFPSCVMSVYLANENVQNNCDISFSAHPHHETVYTNKGWVLSITKPIDVIKTCQSISQQIKLPVGIYVMNFTNNCTYTTPEFVLPVFNSSQSTEESIIIFNHTTFLDLPNDNQSYVNTLKEFKLPNITNFSRFQLHQLTSHMQLSTSISFLSYIGSGITSIFVIILLAFISYWCIKRFMCVDKQPCNTHNTETSGIPRFIPITLTRARLDDNAYFTAARPLESSP